MASKIEELTKNAMEFFAPHVWLMFFFLILGLVKQVDLQN